MPDRQASIYPPAASPADKWATTVLGQLKGSLAPASLDWCWASKYIVPWREDPTSHGTPVSHAFDSEAGTVGRFVKLRYRAADTDPFEEHLARIANRHAWHVSYEDYDLVGDLGSDRYVPEEQRAHLTSPQETQRRRQRAEALVRFLHQGLVLALDALVSDGASWRFEASTHVQNPTGSTFQSVVHLVCNLTDARTVVWVRTPLGITGVEATF